ncbi:MAG: four helix bundle protein [Bacteroidales bacterium]|nr:four helix bundle protein [Bacteroidales bacterium]
MTSFNRFEEIEVWQKARALAKVIYDVVSTPPFNNDNKLRLQMLGSSGSIMDNIAEGQGRGGNKEFKQFLWIAKGSSTELRSQLYRSLDRNFIEEQTFNDLSEKANEIEKMIMGMIRYLDTTEKKGIKYKS